jgi:hypothetical protein
MPRKNLFMLLHPLFLFNLFLLIANDHWWKYAYSNTLTGKISDFAGVFVLAVFLVACFRIRKVIAVLATALFFVWWKSPLSEPVISALGFTRVVDYSDLMALTVLPLVFFIKPFQYPSLSFYGRLLTPIVAGITLLAIVATTFPYKPAGYHYPHGRVAVNKKWRTQLTKEAFFQKLDSLQIAYKKEYVEYLPVNTQGLMLVKKSGADSTYRMTPVGELKDTMLYYEKSLGEHYVIPYFVLGKDTLTNIQFIFHDGSKKRFIEVMAITIPPGLEYDYHLSRPIRKKYWALLKSFMLE